jgi:hexokinase
MAANRLVNLIDQVPLSPQDKKELNLLKRKLMLQTLRDQFTLSPQRLRAMALYMIHEMHVGLASAKGSTLKMLPSYVYKRKVGNTTGVFYALDLGGTNFRVIRMEMKSGALAGFRSLPFAIPQEHITGTHEGLFNFIAHKVKHFMHEAGLADENQSEHSLGFTFSFPVQQTGIASGTLIKWTKGFSTTGVEGNNVVQLLQDAFTREKIAIRVVALCNDTVGTLITQYIQDETTQMGVILGTGSNACYWERSSAVTKEPQVAKHGGEVVINMEFGDFDSDKRVVLPITKYDNIIDDGSSNKGHQLFEKMISGKYLGEIARLILVHLGEAGVLPRTVAHELKKEPVKFDSAVLGRIITDRTPGLVLIERIMKETFGQMLHEDERHTVREVCLLVRHRAAQLSGMAVAATLLKSSTQDNATVAVDGSVFEKTSGFKAIMQKTIATIVGPKCDVRLVLTKDGSGQGAGFIAALQQPAK